MQTNRYRCRNINKVLRHIEITDDLDSVKMRALSKRLWITSTMKNLGEQSEHKCSGMLNLNAKCQVTNNFTNTACPQQDIGNKV